MHFVNKDVFHGKMAEIEKISNITMAFLKGAKTAKLVTKCHKNNFWPYGNMFKNTRLLAKL